MHSAIRYVLTVLLTCLVIPQVYAAQAPRPIKLGLWPYHSAHFLLGVLRRIARTPGVQNQATHAA